MTGIRIVLRGLSDTFENLIYYLLMTMTWWLCLFLVIPAPAATMSLFVHADPRHGSSSDRMTWSETLRYIRANLGRSWLLALGTFPVLFLLAFNFFYYGNSTNGLGILAPLWFVLFFLGVAVTVTAFAVAAIEERATKDAIISALIMVGARLPVIIPLMLALSVVNTIGSVLIVPLAMFIPMTNAAIFTRFVLSSRRIAISDPLEPTPERIAEGKEPRKWFGKK